jgi:calpain
MVEALVDLTGGVSEKFNLEAPETIELRDSGQLWKEIKKFHQLGYLLGCAKNVRDEDGNQEEGIGHQGIQQNHAYGILDIRTALGIQLIRIRNPWGYGEWTGRYADEDEAWDDSKGLKEELNYKFEDDGTWWMRYDDWYMNYNKVYICKIFPATWQQFSIQGEWEGNTAGGAYPPPMRDRLDKNAEHMKFDSNDKWFNNPQFRLTVYKRTQVYISLMQQDEKTWDKDYIPVNFLVVRVQSKNQRLWEVDKNDVVIEAADGAQVFGQREICMT